MKVTEITAMIKRLQKDHELPSVKPKSEEDENEIGYIAMVGFSHHFQYILSTQKMYIPAVITITTAV